MGNSQGLALRSSQNDIVRAAGGLVVRKAGSRLEVAVVHRPARADWSFPKGKLEEGETLEECALREVLEETGLICRLGRFLGHTEYHDRKDRQKVVAYWLMSIKTDVGFEVNDEVDELRWIDTASAATVLSYERDAELLAAIDTPNDAGALAS